MGGVTDCLFDVMATKVCYSPGVRHSSKVKSSSRPRVQSGPRHAQSEAVRNARWGSSKPSMSKPLVQVCPVALKLTYNEVKGDLFECPEEFSLAHCVSADLAMGKGIAVAFKEKFKGVQDLKRQGMYV